MTFSELLDTIENNPAPATTEETVQLLLAAETASDAQPWDWSRLAELLVTKCGVDRKKVARIVTSAKVKAALGDYPYDAASFIPLWLKAFGITMSFDGVFRDRRGHERDTSYILNQIEDWCSSYAGSQRSPFMTKSLVFGALDNWVSDNREAKVAAAYTRVAYDGGADASELGRFARYVTTVHDDPAFDAMRVRATEIALANFIFRVKNHMRRRWKHSCHLMPIFHGPQGSSKTTAIDALLEPLAEVTTKTDFGIFSHDAKEFELTVVPVMFLDEMSGACAADVSRIKQIMTQDRRAVRQLYRAPAMRTLVTTFIGASNKDVSTLIKDETGNRRFLQVETPALDRNSFGGFDMLAIWRSVDEDAAEPPLYASPEATACVKAVQDGQRYRGPVYDWVADGVEKPCGAIVYTDLFNQYYLPWLELNDPASLRFASARAMKSELERLIAAGDITGIKMTNTGNRRHFRFSENDEKTKNPLDLIDLLKAREKAEARN